MDAESLAQIEQIVNGAEGRLRAEIATAVSGTENKLRNEMQTLREELGEKIEAAERHAGTLFEETLHGIDLVVEGHQALFQKIENVEARLEAKIDHESLEMQSLMKLSYRQLQDRVENLEQRVQIIEQRLGLSA